MTISVMNIIKIIALLTAVFSFTAIFNDTHRILELTSHFRLQYLLSSLLCLAIFFASKHYQYAITLLVIAAINSAYILPWFLSLNTHQITDKTTTIKILLSNVNASNTHYDKAIDLVLRESPDIFIVQEVNHSWLSALQSIKHTYPYEHSIPREDNFGIAVFSKHPFASTKDIVLGISGLPSLEIMNTIGDKQFKLITTHPLPPISSYTYQSRNLQLQDAAIAAKNTAEPLVVIGDLNITMWSSDYAPLEKVNMSNCRKGFGVLPTWPTQLQFSALMIPIDHCLVSEHFSVKDMSTGENIGSDHLPIIVEVQL